MFDVTVVLAPHSRTSKKYSFFQFVAKNVHGCALKSKSWMIFSRHSSRADCGIFINCCCWKGFTGIAFDHSCNCNRTEISSNEEQIAQTCSNQC